MSDVELALQECRDELERRNVEFEQTQHSQQLRIQKLESELDQAKLLSSRLEEEKAARHVLEAEKTRLASVEREKGDLERKIVTLEKDKRGLLSLVNKKEVDYEALEKELDEARKEVGNLKKEFRSVETEAQKAKSEKAMKDFEVERIKGECERLRKDRDFYNEELEKRRDEWSKERSEKQSLISTLQSSYDTTRAQLSSTNSQLTVLRDTNTTLQSRLNEALIDLKVVQSKLSESESNFKIEIESLTRLNTLLEEREKEGNKRVADVAEEWERKKEELAAAERSWTEQLEAERERSDRLQEKVEGLEKEKQDLIAGLINIEEARLDGESGISTPRRGRNVPSMTASAKAMQGKKGGKSYTEIYSDFVKVQEDLSAERAEVKRLEAALQEVIDSIEDRAPTLREQRVNYDRIIAENASLTTQLSDAIDARDDYERRAQGYKLDLDAKTREFDISQQQLSDVSAQLRNLMFTLGRMEDPSIEERTGGTAPDFDVRLEDNHVITTGDVITQNLLTFDSIAKLQEQNMKLLRIAREISSRMEETEKQVRERYEDQEREAVEEAHGIIVQLREELESSKLRIESLKREREMFQRMAQNRTPAESQPQRQLLTVDDLTDRGGEVQREFSIYKNEMTLHLDKYREDLDASQKARREAEVSLARVTAENGYLEGRIRNLDLEKKAHLTEMAALQKTTYQLQEQNSRLDNQNNELRSEVVDAKGHADKYKYERDSLKSEREVWKQSETRLTTENENLRRENSNVGNLVTTVQAMLVDTERSNGEARRRLETQVTRLETQLQEAKENLNREAEEHKQIGFRNELQAKEASDKIEKLTSECHLARENYVKAKAELDLHQARLQDLERELAVRDEKLNVYERGSPATSEQSAERELATLRSSISDLTKRLEQSQAHIKQYKLLASNAEESLQSELATFDAFKSDSAAQLADKEAKLAAAEDRLRIVTEELEALELANADLKKEVESGRQGVQKDKLLLDQALSDAKNAEDRAMLARTRAMEEATRLEAQVREWREKYEKEAIDRGSSLSRVQEVQARLDEQIVRVKELEIIESNARANLSAGEETWREMERSLKQEIAAEQTRVEDLSQQNNLLWKQVEELNSRMNAVLAQRSSDGADPGTAPDVTGDEENTGRLHELIQYLRREKDVLVTSAQWKDAEIARLKSDTRDFQRQCDQLRQQLAEERQRTSDLAAESTNRQELEEKMAQVQLFKDSNDTLRRQLHDLRSKYQNAEERVKQVTEELTVIKREKINLEADRDTRLSQIKAISEENQGLRDRQKQFLEKYDRIDPTEFRLAKEKVESLTQELQSVREEASKSLELEKAGKAQEIQQLQDALQAEVADKAREIYERTERFKNLQQQTRTLRTTKDETIKDLTAQLEAKLSSHASELEELKRLHDEQKSRTQADLDRLEREKELLEDQLKNDKENLSADSAEEMQARLAEIAALKQQLQSANDKSSNLSSELQTSKGEIERLRTEVESKSAEVLQLRVEITKKAEEISALQKSAAGDSVATTPVVTDDSKLQQMLREAEERHQAAMHKAARETEERHESAMKKAVQEAIDNTRREKAAATSAVPAVTSAGDEATKLRAELDSLRRELDSLRQSLKEKEAELLASQQALEAEKVIREKEKAELRKEFTLKGGVVSTQLKKAKERTALLEEQLKTLRAKPVAASTTSEPQPPSSSTVSLTIAGTAPTSTPASSSDSASAPPASASIPPAPTQGLSIAGAAKAAAASSTSDATRGRGRGRGRGLNTLVVGALGRGTGIKRPREGDADTTNKKPKPSNGV
ncbi:hypothetical protein BT69DRAFT_1345997 [Atractiella rhizophila]|nr:hypothetical protein BT69DRAFT_1345997 [Atractiella rhizophila]